MIVNINDFSYQTRSDKPNENWTNDDNYLVIEDNTELANKLIDNYPYVSLVVENGVIKDVTIDTEAKTAHETRDNILAQIETLKKNLINSDYKAIKYAEGQISEEDYQPIKQQRQNWRNEINNLESHII